MNLCPGCEAKGRTIKPVTLQGQVVPPRLDQLGEHDGWRLCTSESCEVVYFRDDEVVVLGETRGVPFHKSEDPRRHRGHPRAPRHRRGRRGPGPGPGTAPVAPPLVGPRAIPPRRRRCTGTLAK